MLRSPSTDKSSSSSGQCIPHPDAIICIILIFFDFPFIFRILHLLFDKS